MNVSTWIVKLNCWDHQIWIGLECESKEGRRNALECMYIPEFVKVNYQKHQIWLSVVVRGLEIHRHAEALSKITQTSIRGPTHIINKNY